MLFNSKIELGEKFFQEIITLPVPIDMNTLTHQDWLSNRL